MISWLKQKNKFEIIIIAVTISIFLGLGISFFFIVVGGESYSSIYIIPGTTIHNSEEKTVFYKYGIKSSERGKMDYILNTYIDAKLIKTQNFSLNKGDILDGQDKITIPPETKFPFKIRLNLTTNAATEEIHFWITE